MTTHEMNMPSFQWINVYTGAVPFILQRINRDFHIGDTIIIHERVSMDNALVINNRSVEVQITSLLMSSHDGLVPGWTILGIKRL